MSCAANTATTWRHGAKEGDGLLPELTRIHCIAATDVDTGQPVGAWGPDALGQGLDVLSSADKLIAHFGLGYDFPALAGKLRVVA